MHGKIILATFSIVSMAMQPQAMAQQSKNWSGDVLREFVKASQPKGKSLTVQQFWDQNKKSLHPVWQNRFAPAVEIQKNDKLPKMEVINIKGAQGTESARVMMNIEGKVVSMEYLGGEEKFARINNTVISYQDFYYVTPMLEKLAKEPVFAAEQKKLTQKALASSAVPTREQFGRMSLEQRAEAILKLRLASEAADRAFQLNLEGGVKTSQNFFWDVLIPKAYAKTQAQINAALGKSCLVAGHVGTFNKDAGGYASCQPPASIRTSNCTDRARPHGCNKTFFPTSQSICMAPSRTNQDYQNFTARCAAASPIGSIEDKVKFIKAAQADLKFQQKGDKIEADDAEWTKIDTFMKSHNSAIDETLKSVCSDENVAVVGKVETNLGSACDALKDRKLDLVRFKVEAAAPGPVAGADRPTRGEPGAPCKTRANNSSVEDRPEGFDGKIDKDGNCVPDAVPGAVAVGGAARPDPALVADCKTRGLCPGTAGNGEQTCAPCADRIAGVGGAAGSTRAEASTWDKNKGWIIPVGIFIGVAAILRNLFKAGDVGGPHPANPPAPPPLPVTPTPVIPGPVTPIAGPGSEGGTGTGGAATGGQR